jgi:uncharacterized membrane protein
MKIRKLKWIILLLFFITAIPFFLYFVTFSGPLSDNDQNWSNFGGFIGGVISSIFSFASFLLLLLNFIFDRDKVNKERCIEYLKYVNIFNSEINHIIMDIENIRNYTKNILGENYNYFQIITDNDYFNICSRIDNLKKYLINNEYSFNIPNTNNKLFYDLIMDKINKVLHPDLFINIGKKFEDNACNYYYLIDRPLRNEYKTIIKTFVNASNRKMKEFDIVQFKKMIVDHIYSINENILENKLDREKDLFDNDNY